jgi:SRSO17 transposase
MELGCLVIKGFELINGVNLRESLATGNQKHRYIREIIYGKKGAVTYWEITTDPERMPSNSTSFVKTILKGKLKKTVGNLYGLRTWVEYG